MEFTVTGPHFDITDANREYAQQKPEKLPRYYDRIQGIEVIADRTEHGRYEIEIIVHVDHADPFVAHSDSHDLYACIDETVDKLERQLTDHKEKLRNRKHRVHGQQGQ